MGVILKTLNLLHNQQKSVALTDCVEEELHRPILVDLADGEATVDHTPLDLQQQPQ
jgi:hypothetical protein